MMRHYFENNAAMFCFNLQQFTSTSISDIMQTAEIIAVIVNVSNINSIFITLGSLYMVVIFVRSFYYFIITLLLNKQDSCQHSF